MKKLKKIMEENKEAYENIDRETRDILEVVANIKIPEKFKTIEDGKERYDMCKAFEDMRQEGYEEGISTGIERGIARGIELVNKLNSILVEQNRIMDLKRAAEDSAYQEQLIKELELNV